MKKITKIGPWFLSTLCQASVITIATIALNFSSPTLVKAAEPDVTITIWVANYAKVPRRELSRAERTAETILHDAGIETRWLDLPLEGMHRDPKYDIRRGEFFLRILGETAPRVLRRRAVGSALPCAEPKIGCGAYISYPSAEALAGREVSKAEILGAAMAHEMGHLFLGDDHSSTGIMKPQWSERDLRGATRHELIFSPAQAKQLHAAAQRLRNGIVGANEKR